MALGDENAPVNTYEFAENAGKPNSKISPEEGGSLDQLTQDLQSDKPKRTTFAEGEEEELGRELFDRGKLAEVEICLSSVLDEKTWWSIPRKGKPAWILPRAAWDRMQQSLIDRLNPDHDGPLNKDLFNEPSIASLFPSTEEMPLTLAD